MAELNERTLAASWLDQLRAWIEEATEAGAPEPGAMVLATADAGGAPGARTVLLKGLDERGCAFFTNLRSRKGRELAENPRAALVFNWLAMSRQVRVDGRVEPLSAEESDAYFQSRPLGARRSAVASPQSEVVASRAELEERVAEVGEAPARPDWWGGLRVVPHSVEFWQGRADRLHDRLRFRLEGGVWLVERLAP